MMRKFNIKIFNTNFLCAEKFVDLTLKACRTSENQEISLLHFFSISFIGLISSESFGRNCTK